MNECLYSQVILAFKLVKFKTLTYVLWRDKSKIYMLMDVTIIQAPINHLYDICCQFNFIQTCMYKSSCHQLQIFQFLSVS